MTQCNRVVHAMSDGESIASGLLVSSLIHLCLTHLFIAAAS
jgi:hypothetical protein